MTLRNRLIVLSVVVGLAACGKSQNVVAPSGPQFAGTWIGTGFFIPQNPLTFTIQESGASLSGTWSEGGGSPNGLLSGTGTGSNVSITFNLRDNLVSCPYPIQITATINGDQMNGSYSSAGGYCDNSSFKRSGTGVWNRTAPR